jgi:hypothetical protein
MGTLQQSLCQGITRIFVGNQTRFVVLLVFFHNLNIQRREVALITLYVQQIFRMIVLHVLLDGTGLQCCVVAVRTLVAAGGGIMSFLVFA